MNKMNRMIDENRMNESKERTIEAVLQSVKRPTRRTVFEKYRLTFITGFALVALAIFTFVIPPNGNYTDVKAYQSETIAEVSYLTSSLISSNLIVKNTDILYLSNDYLIEDTTQFEENDNVINLYFNTLKVFLEDDLFSSSVVTTVSDTDPNTYIITFQAEQETFVLTITFNQEQFTGTLEVNGDTYDVTGVLEDTPSEFKLVLAAENETSAIEIEYKTERKEAETQHQYQIRQDVNGTVQTKEIKVSRELTGYKVEIKENENQYQLKKEQEGTEFQYKLEYSLNGTTGEAIIQESVDQDGNVSYSYQIKEGSIEKEIIKGKPENPGNNNGKGNSGKQKEQHSEDFSKLFEI